MQDLQFKNKIAPWQEHGRWYNIKLHCENTSGSTYTWIIDEYDPIFTRDSSEIGKIYIMMSSANISLKNMTGVAHTIYDIKKFMIPDDPTNVLTATTISGGVLSALLISGTTSTSIATGASPSASMLNRTFNIWLFMD